MSNRAFSRIRTCALATLVVFFIGSPASAQEARGNSETPVAFSLSFPQGPVSFQVPADHRLVIEYVSGICPTTETTSGNIPPSPILTIVTNGVSNTHRIAIPFSVAPQNFVKLGQLVKIYADAGTSVTLSVAQEVECDLTFSGQLVRSR